MKKKTLQRNFKVIANNKVKDNYFKLVLAAAGISSMARPGQFVMIETSSTAFAPLLRRPMSIHSAQKGRIEILYETVGEGSRILTQKRPGEHLNLIGPLGNGFEIADPGDRNSILVAGGMGVAPLLFLAEKLVEHKSKNARVRIRVFIGAKTAGHLLCEKEFKSLGCDVKIATDDGTKGFKGWVTELLEETLSGIATAMPRIYTCGPMSMLESIAGLASEYGMAAYGSFEAHMACGIGACMGCVIRTQDEKRKERNDFVYRRVCKEGPVFQLNQVIWGEE
ncbi:MAG: dihydroorotate dehydrogenase electron transfer subunit [Candidatus Omnitrophica bacterium]|nr:dihydroorotate dehydrogenase electron transfer subunit [Candidatus Omnitrophota bacterium]